MAAPGADIYHPSERRPHAQRLREQEAALGLMLAAVAGSAPAVAEQLAAAGLTPAEVTLDRLSTIPVVPKAALPALQAARPPFGGWLAVPISALRRIFVSPGPIFDPEGREEDYWGLAPALYAAGFRAGQVVINTFSHHLTPAGSMMDGACGALGCVAVPTGVGNLEIQARTLLDVQAVGFLGTPSFLAALLDKTHETGSRSPLQVAFVSGEPLAESLRARLETQYGVRVSQGYAIGDVGLIAHECPPRTGFHLVDRVIVELIDPATAAPVEPGQAGEVVVTFLNPHYPLLRLGTGDLSRVAGGTCPCGRTAPRLERVLGRVGDAVKVRGIFLHPFDLERAMAGHPEIARYQAVVTRTGDQDVLTVRVELSGGEGAAVRAAAAHSVREHTRLRADIAVVPAGTIGADDRRILDQRIWD
ncbi:MAG TPA: AMP-binding protein [bacterium]|jgi:phenylacetate-CoA ligase|nr:AMP-binding protein [bacterium]